MEKSLKKTILSTSFITFGAVVAVLFVVLFVLALFFPVVIADLSLQAGNESWASIYYSLDYDRNDNLDSIYKAVNLAIDEGDSSKIAKYYAKFEKNEDYLDYIDKINILNSKSRLIDYPKSLILNESNFLKQNYVSALFDLGENDKAKKYIIDNFRTANPDNFDKLDMETCLKYQMTNEIYLFQELVYLDMTAGDIEFFNNTHSEKYPQTLLTEMFALSNIYVDIFNTFADSNTNKELNPFVIMCGNMSLEICNDLKIIYEVASQNDISVNLTATHYSDLNLVIKDLSEKLETLVNKKWN